MGAWNARQPGAFEAPAIRSFGGKARIVGEPERPAEGGAEIDAGGDRMGSVDDFRHGSVTSWRLSLTLLMRERDVHRSSRGVRLGTPHQRENLAGEETGEGSLTVHSPAFGILERRERHTADEQRRHDRPCAFCFLSENATPRTREPEQSAAARLPKCRGELDQDVLPLF
jgi:hypothetical protein